MSDRFVLILGAGLMQRPSIEAAKELGYKALVIDGNPDAVCVPYADRFEKIDLKDTEAVVNLALSMGSSLHAVFTAGTDFSYPVSVASQKCGLAAHSAQAALQASNKISMRRCFKKFNIPSPDFFEADESFLISVKKNGVSGITFPKVIKPVDNMGARGCRLARDESEFLFALNEALRFSRSGKAIVEDFMEGPEFSIDALVVDGKVIVTGFADRHIFFEPYFVELGHSMPSGIPEKQKMQIISVFTDAVHALGLSNGAAKGDVKYTSRGPMIGEIAARLSGGYMSGWTFPYSSGFNLTKEALKISLGASSDFSGIDEIKSSGFSHERAFISIPGKIKKIYGEDKAWASPFVKNIFFRVKEGMSVDFPRNNVEKCGNVISASAGRELSRKGAENAVSRIVLRLEPSNSETDRFLCGEELPCEKGFPVSAFRPGSELKKFFNGIGKNFAIEKNCPAADLIPSELTKPMEEVRDWNFRSIIDTVHLFDRISPLHPRLGAAEFWRCLLRGGIQGVLYYSDSVQLEEK
ncbi:ATP-grasp domain-containing protein [Treponema sp.]|uniref:ATP-grasp domain-containing protein n=1 Tax=Treponema sp. TaxID=166 RepID=UPI003F05753E